MFYSYVAYALVVMYLRCQRT